MRRKTISWTGREMRLWKFSTAMSSKRHKERLVISRSQYCS